MSGGLDPFCQVGLGWRSAMRVWADGSFLQNWLANRRVEEVVVRSKDSVLVELDDD